MQAGLLVLPMCSVLCGGCESFYKLLNVYPVPPVQALSRPSSLDALEEALAALLGQYCSQDLLAVEKVTWQSPSDLIEKVSGASLPTSSRR